MSRPAIGWPIERSKEASTSRASRRGGGAWRRPSGVGAVPAKPAPAVPGPRGPRLAQTLLGVIRPLEARMTMRRRYGNIFRTNDAIAGELFHVADREAIEQM